MRHLVQADLDRIRQDKGLALTRHMAVRTRIQAYEEVFLSYRFLLAVFLAVIWPAALKSIVDRAHDRIYAQWQADMAKLHEEQKQKAKLSVIAPGRPAILVPSNGNGGAA